MNGIKFDRAADIIKNCENKKIAVIGDIMLDRFFWGAVSRVSPKHLYLLLIYKKKPIISA
jgi:bifunctional ADP-heptose synthase (sugar kinase/adenylyltransferase)